MVGASTSSHWLILTVYSDCAMVLVHLLAGLLILIGRNLQSVQIVVLVYLLAGLLLPIF